MIASLQSWRYIFALMIFFHHLDGLFMQGGACGVSFFMVLSGFVMSLGYYDKVQRPEFSFWIFMQKRLFRLYPLHLLCMVGVVLLHCKSLSLGFLATLVPQAVLLQSWIPYQEIYFAGNALSWCLADMMFFYLMFPYIVRYIEHHTRKVLAFMAVVMLGVYALLLVYLPDAWCHPVLYINPLLRLYDFVLGVCLYRLYLHFEAFGWGSGLSYLQKSGLEMLAVGLLVGYILLHPYLPERYIMACFYWFPSSIIILLFARFNISGGVISDLLKQKWIVYMGGVSFSLYMIHILCFQYFDYIRLKIGIPMDLAWKLPVYLVAVSLLAIAINRWFEVPVSNYLHKKTFK